jgi:hypothetical protein
MVDAYHSTGDGISDGLYIRHSHLASKDALVLGIHLAA